MTAPAARAEKEFSEAISNNLYYLHRDHLGSINLITDNSGNVVEKRQFDAWGNLVKLQDGSGTDLANFVILDRGYTGHEHLLGVGLINLNARLYDPLLHRFLEPDNYVQDPGSSQGFNRYGYVGNNPLSRADQSGEFWNLVIGGLIGGTVNWISHGARFNAKGLGYFAVGAAAGALGAGIGGGINVSMANGSFSAGFMGTAAGVSSTGFLAGAASGLGEGFTNGFISNVGNRALGGGSVRESLSAGLKSGLGQGLAGGIMGGLIGGVDAVIKKVNFFTGNADLDLSKGFGAHNVSNINQSIGGKFVGKYHEVNVFESSSLEKGAGITLPGYGITVSKGAFSLQSDPRLLQHEFGHILQSRLVGMKAFYGVIATESVLSAAMEGVKGYSHQTFWIETWANFLSQKKLGSSYLLSKLYPIQDISTFNYLKLALYSSMF